VTTTLAAPSTLSSANGTIAMLIPDGGAPPPNDPRATDVILVRHGETDWNRNGRCQGLAETSLNASGVAQAKRVFDALLSTELDAAYTSPLRRARETARIVLTGRRLAPIPMYELREIDYWRLTGLAADEWRAIDGAMDGRWRDTPWDVAFQDGDSLAEVSRRVTPIWDQLVAQHEGERVLLVGHGHVHRLLLLHSMDIDLRQFWTIAQPNGGVWCARIPIGDRGSWRDER